MLPWSEQQEIIKLRRVGLPYQFNRVLHFVGQQLVELQSAAQTVGYEPFGIELFDFGH